MCVMFITVNCNFLLSCIIKLMENYPVTCYITEGGKDNLHWQIPAIKDHLNYSETVLNRKAERISNCGSAKSPVSQCRVNSSTRQTDDDSKYRRNELHCVSLETTFAGREGTYV